ncbi:uncharacterized protein [Glycine max]|nr:uncharacterized protein LOC100812851 isoform X4 [Glycine max]XP_040866984.1 uncharacterized protein LOC100812851 isoform X4 [Glycine max]XP_040866985.1 uncharacterized protein LOC100812851 isoform X4 [Glycine max]XP_040866986.1 uncharacterized protein LOC100812851 isoform X4 [Glycine max]XP_040866987.1 uncharacterized protein LOC100812851 isoform X4 [Glycine max]XP_040866988.1 uncharacterized protein LOC100812851 isoform X4 [Glycine max]|eukprot:XP_014625262.1 uncharacterized protein LOC100812851 isoform X3 [Glycine max]
MYEPRIVSIEEKKTQEEFISQLFDPTSGLLTQDTKQERTCHYCTSGSVARTKGKRFQNMIHFSNRKDVWRFVHELGYSNESSSKTKGELYSVVCSPIDAALVATAGGDDRGFLWKIGQADWAFELQGNGFLRGFLHLGITYHSILKANMKKVKHLVEPPDSKTKLSLWKADLAQEGSFDEAIKGCTGVFHVATPMDFDSKDTEGKIKQTMDKAFWDGIMENEAGEKRPCITFFQRHGWSIMKFIPYGTVYVGICVV